MLVLHQDAGDHKGPLHVRSAALAPTDQRTRATTRAHSTLPNHPRPYEK